MAPASKKVMALFIIGNGTSTWFGRPSEALEVDVSTAISEADAKCFKSSGVTAVIARALKNDGDDDAEACHTLNQAEKAGITTRDIFMDTCIYGCDVPQHQELPIDQFSKHIVKFDQRCDAFTGRVWIDISKPRTWLNTYQTNQAWLMALVDSCRVYFNCDEGRQDICRCGIFTSKDDWTTIFGNVSFKYGYDLPLWYAHNDKNQTFSDFQAFGGWTAPKKKQFSVNSSICNVTVNKNFVAGAASAVIV